LIYFIIFNVLFVAYRF